MTIDTTIVGTYQGKTAEQWREAAKVKRNEAHESFERCDTDGHLSQWAWTMGAQENERCAQLAETNGMWEFEALFDLDGNLASTEEVPSQYYHGQPSWLVRRPGDRPLYISTSRASKGARRQAADETKGYRLGTVRRPAVVKASGDRVNLNYYFAPDPDSDAYEIVDNGTGGTRYENWSN